LFQVTGNQDLMPYSNNDMTDSKENTEDKAGGKGRRWRGSGFRRQSLNI
jgi:hypothetical protein